MPLKEYTDYYIEVAPHIQKFVESENGQIIEIKPSNLLGHIVLSKMQKLPDNFVPEKKPSASHIIIRIANCYTRKPYSDGPYMSDKARQLIRNGLWEHFREETLEFVKKNVKFYGGKDLPTLRKFRETYRITDDDYPEDHHYRTFKNWKKNKRFLRR